VARSWWRHGDEVVEARRRGVVKHDHAHLQTCGPSMHPSIGDKPP
jgi:hypothetical protein